MLWTKERPKAKTKTTQSESRNIVISATSSLVPRRQSSAAIQSLKSCVEEGTGQRKTRTTRFIIPSQPGETDRQTDLMRQWRGTMKIGRKNISNAWGGGPGGLLRRRRWWARQTIFSSSLSFFRVLLPGNHYRLFLASLHPSTSSSKRFTVATTRPNPSHDQMNLAIQCRLGFHSISSHSSFCPSRINRCTSTSFVVPVPLSSGKSIDRLIGRCGITKGGPIRWSSVFLFCSLHFSRGHYRRRRKGGEKPVSCWLIGCEM